MKSKHFITNITSDKVVYSYIENGGETYEIHEFIADRKYESGDTDKQTVVIVNQKEYDEIKKYGYYNIDDLEFLEYLGKLEIVIEKLLVSQKQLTAEDYIYYGEVFEKIHELSLCLKKVEI